VFTGSTEAGADVLAAMFDQTESPAVWLPGEQGMSQEGIVSSGSRVNRQAGTP
jgi:hypothetical protein